jgi:uncharacterized protein YkwD
MGVIASAILILSLASTSAGAVEILAGSRITMNEEYKARQEILSSEVATLGGGGDGNWQFKDRERCFMRRINRIRKQHGLNKLRWDRHLGVVGRKHAHKLAKAKSIWHDDVGAKVTRWRSLGQNTGKGPGCRKLTRAFMHSPGHRANYLGKWRHVGVGVVRTKGTTYVQQVFERRRDPGNIWHKP